MAQVFYDMRTMREYHDAVGKWAARKKGGPREWAPLRAGGPLECYAFARRYNADFVIYTAGADGLETYYGLGNSVSGKKKKKKTKKRMLRLLLREGKEGERWPCYSLIEDVDSDDDGRKTAARRPLGKAATTVQKTIKKEPKTNAQKCRARRARRKAEEKEAADIVRALTAARTRMYRENNEKEENDKKKKKNA